MKKQTIVYDTEIIGLKKPVFLVCIKILETKQSFSFWQHKKGDLKRFLTFFDDPKYTWVGFNSLKFDAPLIAAWINGHGADVIKMIATKIITERMMPWESFKLAGIDGLDFDHVDLFEVAPGKMTSLKTYAGRMHYPSMVDLPFHYDLDLTPAQCKVLETYCMNDLGVTEALYELLKEEITLREELGELYDLELRSKSSPQVSEAILKKVVGLGKNKNFPSTLMYDVPPIIKLKNPKLIDLADKLSCHAFRIDALGSPILPDWLEGKPLELHGGTYQVGIGGLHSQHDKQLYLEADDEWRISDFDVASYYPSLILRCGYVPSLNGKGQLLMDTYKGIYEQRLEAKRSGNKKVAGVLKLALNGAYGKLGSIYCSFYAPDLMLAVCLTGQLNLLNLIDALAKQKGIEVISANTDGITVRYHVNKRANVLKDVALNSKQTGFEWEETQYSKVDMKDVNNYIVIKTDGGVKAKGIYAPPSLEKNPTAYVCSLAAAEYLKNGTTPEKFIAKQRKLEPFLSIRNVKGGGVQHTKYATFDDWVEAEPGKWVRTKVDGGLRVVSQKSRPAPVECGVGGVPFGRVARWFMTTDQLPAITYVSNGNKVPLTEGAKLCMTIPATMPADLDRKWYVASAYEILADLGVKLA